VRIRNKVEIRTPIIKRFIKGFIGKRGAQLERVTNCDARAVRKTT
jgi:hypothetical protein